VKQNCRAAAKHCRVARGMGLVVGLAAQKQLALVHAQLDSQPARLAGIGPSLASRPTYKSSLAANVEIAVRNSKTSRGRGHTVQLCCQHTMTSVIRFFRASMHRCGDGKAAFQSSSSPKTRRRLPKNGRTSGKKCAFGATAHSKFALTWPPKKKRLFYSSITC
jgi:hypothetical protein